MRGLYPGRFQPFHYGHLSVVKWALERVDELIILIGSAQESHTLTNPFTAGERIEMIKNSLSEYDIPSNRFYIIPVPDISMNNIWAYHVKSYVPRFHKVIGRNPLVIRLFKEAGVETENSPEFDRINYNSTYIRKLIIGNDSRWKKLVPKSVIEVIEEINGDERLREIVGFKN